MRAKAYRVTKEGQFVPLRLELLIVGFWSAVAAVGGWSFYEFYRLVRFLLG